MGMQDNPLVGDYTKGISKNTVEYMRNLDRRVKEEKGQITLLAYDLANPLFAMIRGPVNPLDLNKKGELKQTVKTEQIVKSVKNVDKSVENQAKRPHTKSWKTVSLAQLKEAFDQVQGQNQGRKRARR